MSQTQEVIESIQGIATESAKIAIEQYSTWYFTNAVVWLSMGLFLVLFGFILHKNASKTTDESIANVASVGVIIIGILLIFGNIVNLFSPEAYAIHQLLNDLRGS